METLRGAMIICQSGGPTAVINASVYGAIRTALDADCITRVYGGHYGIKGVLNDELFIMDYEDDKELERLLYTPSSALGSCRYKLASPEQDDTDFKRIYEIFRKYDVRYFCYNGGNDSMDTCDKIQRYMARVGYECRIMGIPKTVDNDLVGTDHCPGYGSAAKYIATSMMEAARDAHVYEAGTVLVVECMGRHAGWLTAAATLANINEPCCDYVYLPEVAFDMDKFLEDVRSCYERHGNCVVAVSEGIKYADGSFVADGGSKSDAFGHAQLGGVAVFLAAKIKEKLGYKVRPLELSLLQRSASHLASLTDIREAEAAGKAAVQWMIEGRTGEMVLFDCKRENGRYSCEMKGIDLSEVANFEKPFPLEWLNEDCNKVMPQFTEYALPLIQGETTVEKENGLPRFALLKRLYAR